MSAHRLDIIDLSCARGDRSLFADIRVEVSAGELLHVAGANGSGKTTLLRALCGLTQPAAGEVRWGGTPIRKLGDEYRDDLAYVGHKDGIQGELTPPENLAALACAIDSFDAAAASRALEQLGLAAHRAFPAKTLSHGQRRRLALARLLVAHKPLWLLDEPYTALDADSCRLMSRLLAEHLANDGIVVLTSHQRFDIAGAVSKQIDLDRAPASARRRSAGAAASANSDGR